MSQYNDETNEAWLSWNLSDASAIGTREIQLREVRVIQEYAPWQNSQTPSSVVPPPSRRDRTVGGIDYARVDEATRVGTNVLLRLCLGVAAIAVTVVAVAVAKGLVELVHYLGSLGN